MDTLKIYNQMRSVPAEAKKTIAGGKLKGMTDINPMWRIKRLTEVFGVSGFGWKTDNVRYDIYESAGESVVICSLNLYVKMEDKWSDAIYGVGGSKLVGKGIGEGINDEAYKMAYTDAISVACKALGVAADVYYEKDRTKYDTESGTTKTTKASPVKEQVQQKQKPTDKQIQNIAKRHLEGDKEVWAKAKQAFEWTQDEEKKLTEAILKLQTNTK